MTDRPIIFSGSMARALIEGRKTQTRRVIVPPKPFDIGDDIEVQIATGEIKLRWAVGDRLWVREAHYLTDNGHEEYAVFAADADEVREHIADVEKMRTDSTYDLVVEAHARLRPSIHMPRWASRLTLTVTEVRVQRLQEISKEDAIAEGCGLYVPGHGFITNDELRGDPGYSNFLSSRMGFEATWVSLHGAGAWDSNPWVAAISFEVEQRNIDALKEAA